MSATGPPRRALSAAEVLGLAQNLHAQGRWAEAEGAYAYVLKRSPDTVAALHGLGLAQAASGQPEAALASLERALALTPGSADLHNDLGTVLAAIGRHQDSVRHFTAACELAPGHAAAYSNLGSALAALHRYADAVASLRVAIATDPQDGTAHANLGSALLELNHPADALPHLDRALAVDPDLAEAHQTRGHARVTLGDLAGAERDFARAVALRPDRGDFYEPLAAVRLLASDDPDFLALQALSRTTESGSARGRIGLHFALHRAYEHQGRHAEALDHLIRGNADRRATMPYDEAETLGAMARIARVFDAERMRRSPQRPAAPGLPIFVLGMPRSGSTLVEQILASHRDVHGTGELPLLNEAATRLGGTGGLAYPESALARSDVEFAAFGEDYLARLRALAPGAARATDKMPLNFRHVGLIRLTLPGARVIHTRRDPADTCLSCFAQTFSQGLAFTNDLAELGRYYRAYAGLMAHWHHVLPEPFLLDVIYEELVADFEPQVRRLLEFCGLDWDPACLAFHEHQRPVRTVSASQVRRPLYQGSVARARRYGALLQPLYDALGVPASAGA